MESLSVTVQVLMHELAEQRLEAKEQARKLDEQAKIIAYWECHETPEEDAAPPQRFQFSPDVARGSLPIAEDADWSEWKEPDVPPPAPGISPTVENSAGSSNWWPDPLAA